MKSIIFISGFGVPQFIAKSKFLWNQSLWSDYKCFWLSSRTPTSDRMVEKELDRLQRLLASYPDAAVAGQSLGAWWAANLALRPGVNVRKLAFWTGLCDANEFPIFNVTPRYNPTNQERTDNLGVLRVISFVATEDVIVPADHHGFQLERHFKAMPCRLEGGHLYQANHQSSLEYMKEWIER